MALPRHELHSVPAFFFRRYADAAAVLSLEVRGEGEAALDWNGVTAESRRNLRYTKTFRVRFGHSDPAGIAYYPRFFEWFHDGFEGLFEDAFGLGYAAALARWRVGFPAVQTACEFRRPAVFGDLVELEVFISRLGDRSATFEYRVRGDGLLLATASVKVVATDLDSKTSTWLPSEIREKFKTYVEEDDEGPRTERMR